VQILVNVEWVAIGCVQAESETEARDFVIDAETLDVAKVEIIVRMENRELPPAEHIANVVSEVRLFPPHNVRPCST
jgi:hypothetical protein